MKGEKVELREMWAVVQESAGGKLVLRELPIPKPKRGQVLVKMDYAAINPSDLSMLQGTYAHKPEYPVIPGIEGSGTVVASGGGMLAAMRMGKRVSCTSTEGCGGTWAEYMLSSAMHVVPVNKSIDAKQAASTIVNPLTAIAFMNITKKSKEHALLNNAAGGALGKMLVALGQRENIEVVSVVRNQQQLESLKALGAKYVLNSSEEDYCEQLKAVADTLKLHLYFDALGGRSTDDLVRCSPEGSRIYMYANLSEEKSSFDPRTLLQQRKEIRGFFLGNYSADQNLIKTLRSIKKVHRLISNELKTDFCEEYGLADVEAAVESYSNNMSKGKILLNCRMEKY